MASKCRFLLAVWMAVAVSCASPPAGTPEKRRKCSAATLPRDTRRDDVGFRLVSPVSIHNGEFEAIVPGDLDGDGDDDFVAPGKEGDWLFVRESSGYVGSRLARQSYRGAFVDVDQDGALDYVFAPKESPGQLRVAYGSTPDGVRGHGVELLGEEELGFTPSKWSLIEGGRGFAFAAADGSRLVVLGYEPRRGPWVQHLDGEIIQVAEMLSGKQVHLLVLHELEHSPEERKLSVFSFSDSGLLQVQTHAVPGARRFVVLAGTAASGPVVLFGTDDSYRSAVIDEAGNLEWRSEQKSVIARGVRLVPGRGDLAHSYGLAGVLELVMVDEQTIRVVSRHFVGRSHWVRALREPDGGVGLIAQADYGVLLHFPVNSMGESMEIPAPVLMAIGEERAYDIAAADLDGDGKEEILATFPVEGRIGVYDWRSGLTLQDIPAQGAMFLGVLEGKDVKPLRIGVSGASFAVYGAGSAGLLEQKQTFEIRGIGYRVLPLVQADVRGFVVPVPSRSAFEVFLEQNDASFRAVASGEFSGIGPATSAWVDLDCDGEQDIVSVDFYKSEIHAFRGRGDGVFEHIGATKTAGAPLAIEAWSTDRGAVVLVGSVAARELRSYVLSPKGEWTHADSLELEVLGLPMYNVIPRMIRRVKTCESEGSWIVLGDGGQIRQGKIDADGRLTIEHEYPSLALGAVYSFVLSDIDGDGADDLIMAEGDQHAPWIGVWMGACGEVGQ